MNKRSGSLTGASGTYFVASQLAFQNFHAAITFGNAPMVDILVCRANGAASLALQVKTTESALRTRGRGKDKKLHHYEWDAGYKAAHTAQKNLFYAFVDLKKFETTPDVFFVPSSFLVNWFEPYGILKRYRFHPSVQEMKQFKNNWPVLRERLEEKRKCQKPTPSSLDEKGGARRV